MEVLLITDNEVQLGRFRSLISDLQLDLSHYKFNYAYSYMNKSFEVKFRNEDWIHSINVKKEVDSIIEKFDLIISLHCKQLFPSKLVERIRCINIHPGLNPHNRGWFPQVFSILNSLPCGATIHEIDEALDHGPIICQKEVVINKWDTSLSAYEAILEIEMELLTENLIEILEGTYSTYRPKEGNLNLKADFNNLLELDLEDTNTLSCHIDYLRALTHGNYNNAYFVDATTGKKVYVKIELTVDE
jgi:methionyl-tRNA formyltransferase